MYAEDGDGNIYNDNSSTEADGKTKDEKQELPKNLSKSDCLVPLTTVSRRGIPESCLSNKLSRRVLRPFLPPVIFCFRLTLATFDDEGHCIGHMGSWSFSSWTFNQYHNPNPPLSRSFWNKFWASKAFRNMLLWLLAFPVGAHRHCLVIVYSKSTWKWFPIWQRYHTHSFYNNFSPAAWRRWTELNATCHQHICSRFHMSERIHVHCTLASC